jgi:hypothetical protein
MQYNDKEHHRNKKYKEDNLIWDNREYKANEDFEKEIFLLKEEDFKKEYEIMEYKIQYISPVLIQQPKYQEEEYFSRDFGDTHLYKWLSQIKHDSAAILAEMISAPRLSPHIESLRPQVKNMKTITIDEYRKIKCIGSTKVNWLKQLKKKYGLNLLRFLYAFS